MADVSHRGAGVSVLDRVFDTTHNGSPEGVISALPGSSCRNLQGGAGTTFYVKVSGSGNTGWIAVGSVSDVAALQASIAALETDVGTLEAANVALDTRLDTAETDIDALQAADTALDGRLDAIEAADWVTTTRIDDEAVTVAKIQVATESLVGRGGPGTGAAQAVSVSGGLEWVNGDSIQRSALTGDVTASLGSGSTTIANDAVTNAKLANMATQTFKGRTTAGTGDPEDLSIAQAKALLDVDDAETAIAALQAIKHRAFVFFGAPSRTANVSGRYLNAVGWATNPAGTGISNAHSPVTGNVVAVCYRMNSIPLTSATITPRVNGSEAAGAVTVNSGGALGARVAIDPIAVTAGQPLACRLDQVGTGGTDQISVSFEIEYTP